MRYMRPVSSKTKMMKKDLKILVNGLSGNLILLESVIV